MKNEVCVVRITQKSIDNFYNQYRECKQCKFQRSVKRCC